ncbi:hypothetical protein H0H81_001214 [Sphagnurus paluster]|uniref:Kelch repeat-containing protein n=1 Tax=Sphagnurus paluster TaxID=117069 RepID=A0A9P7FU66_9AGAR|nr:hypothetical protein H0H81_001214 [Sphagnurus paluster]
MPKLDKVVSLRHPDPSVTAKLKVEHPELQVYGSWAKLSIKKSGGMKARLAFTSFIWKGHLYVGGGLGETKGPCFRDLWRLNLSKLNTWESLPPYPFREDHTGVWMCWNMKVYKDKAYMFTGLQEISVFDLNAQEWTTVHSTYKPTNADIAAGVETGRKWPYIFWNSQRSTQEIVGDKLYVFGGTHGKTVMGCNLFMVLDLKTLEWRRLSGVVQTGLVADYSSPGPRRNPSSWVSRDKKRIYLIFGECDRTAASMNNEPHGAEMGFAYEDFWSWDIAKEEWRLERLVGNVPSPRSEAACTYNEKLDKTFVFGGYNPGLVTVSGLRMFPFTYYGDTFMWCPSGTSPAGQWKQVLTRGFPTYRAQSQFVSDPDTGKIYLFGGYVNTEAVPSRKDYNSRTFGDVWQLRVDLPGGCF